MQAFNVPIPEADAERVVNALTPTPAEGTEAERSAEARRTIYRLIAREVHAIERQRASSPALTIG